MVDDNAKQGWTVGPHRCTEIPTATCRPTEEHILVCTEQLDLLLKSHDYLTATFPILLKNETPSHISLYAHKRRSAKTSRTLHL